MVLSSFGTTHVMLSSKNSKDTMSGMAYYYLNVYHCESPTGGTLMYWCFSWRTSATGLPVFIQTSSGRRRPPPLRSYNFQSAWCTLQDRKVMWKRRDITSSSYSYFPTFTYHATASSFLFPTSTAFQTESYRSILLDIRFQMPFACLMPGFFVIIT